MTDIETALIDFLKTATEEIHGLMDSPELKDKMGDFLNCFFELLMEESQDGKNGWVSCIMGQVDMIRSDRLASIYHKSMHAGFSSDQAFQLTLAMANDRPVHDILENLATLKELAK